MTEHISRSLEEDLDVESLKLVEEDASGETSFASRSEELLLQLWLASCCGIARDGFHTFGTCHSIPCLDYITA